jgi:uncharacterized repeat protein (TIGR03803 family)
MKHAIASIMLGSTMLAPALAHAASETTVFALNDADGAQPAGGVILDKAGNLFGMATYGGLYNGGTLFEIPAYGAPRVLHHFQIFAYSGNPPWQPYGTLVIGKDGTLFGTGSLGGAVGCGAVFKLVPGVSFTNLHDFRDNPDGCNPTAGLIADDAGNLYGTTEFGGPAEAGTVFRIAPGGAETILHAFGGTGDASSPQARLTRDASGNLYGTASSGGAAGQGAIFKITPDGQESVLYSFTGGADGAGPVSEVSLDAEGNLVGTAYLGGDPACVCGTVYKLAPSGTLTVLFTFTNQATQGANPAGGLYADGKGYYYGTGLFGGAYDHGVAFRIAPDGSETVLTSFPGTSGANGPAATLIPDHRGRLLGTSTYGGKFSNHPGTVFAIRP